MALDSNLIRPDVTLQLAPESAKAGHVPRTAYKPTIGRIVLVHGFYDRAKYGDNAAVPAIVNFVFDDGSVHIKSFFCDCQNEPARSWDRSAGRVFVYEPGVSFPNGERHWAEWMPYQAKEHAKIAERANADAILNAALQEDKRASRYPSIPDSVATGLDGPMRSTLTLDGETQPHEVTTPDERDPYPRQLDRSKMTFDELYQESRILDERDKRPREIVADKVRAMGFQADPRDGITSDRPELRRLGAPLVTTAATDWAGPSEEDLWYQWAWQHCATYFQQNVGFSIAMPTTAEQRQRFRAFVDEAVGHFQKIAPRLAAMKTTDHKPELVPIPSTGEVLKVMRSKHEPLGSASFLRKVAEAAYQSGNAHGCAHVERLARQSASQGVGLTEPFPSHRPPDPLTRDGNRYKVKFTDGDTEYTMTGPQIVDAVNRGGMKFDWKVPLDASGEECFPHWDAEFEKGHIPTDEPPGLEERYYRVWKDRRDKENRESAKAAYEQIQNSTGTLWHELGPAVQNTYIRFAAAILERLKERQRMADIPS